MLGVDDGARASEVLRLGDDVLDHGGFAGRFWSKDLEHPTAWRAANAESDVESDRAGGDRIDRHSLGSLAQLHDGAFAELLLDVCDARLDRLAPVCHAASVSRPGLVGHWAVSSQKWPVWFASV
jgi:hypothetical protein